MTGEKGDEAGKVPPLRGSLSARARSPNRDRSIGKIKQPSLAGFAAAERGPDAKDERTKARAASPGRTSSPQRRRSSLSGFAASDGGPKMRNLTHGGNQRLAAAITSTTWFPQVLSDGVGETDGGNYVQLKLRVAGEYVCTVTLGGEMVCGSPYTIYVQPAEVDAGASGPDYLDYRGRLEPAVSGTESTTTIICRDMHGNRFRHGGERLLVQLRCPETAADPGRLDPSPTWQRSRASVRCA